MTILKLHSDNYFLDDYFLDDYFWRLKCCIKFAGHVDFLNKFEQNSYKHIIYIICTFRHILSHKHNFDRKLFLYKA